MISRKSKSTRSRIPGFPASLAFLLAGAAGAWLWVAHAENGNPEKPGAFGALEDSKLVEVVENQIAKQSLDKTVDLYNAEVFQGATAAIQYKYRSEPSYQDGYYTRYDNYSVQANLNPAAFVKQLNGPFALGLSVGSQLVFARQFKSQAQSVTALPYLPDRIPLTAERARTRLETGDFVAFETDTGVMISAGLAIPVAQMLSQSASTFAYLQGHFLVHLFKVDADHIRMKLIAKRSGGGGANLDSQFGFKLTGFSLVENQIRKYVEIDPVTLGASRDLTDLFMADYVFDLRSAEASGIYERIMTRKSRFKALELAQPLSSRSGLEAALVTDLTEAEALAAQDSGKPESERRISRLFRGSNASDTVSGSIQFGLNLLRFEQNGYYSQNQIHALDEQNQPRKYRFDTFSLQKTSRYLFRLFDSSESITAGVLFLADDRYEPQEFSAMVLSRERKSSSITPSEIGEIRDQLQRTLPASLFSRIPWKNWTYGRGERVNVYFRHQVAFTLDSLNAMPSLGMPELYERLRGYLDSIPAPEATPGTDGTNSEAEQNSWRRSNSDKYAYDLQVITLKLNQAFSPEHSPSERFNAFVSLKDNALFREIGAGFLLRLLPEDRLEDLIRYEMTLSGKDSDSVELRFGRSGSDRLYQSLLYIQSVLNGTSIDLRLERK